MVILRGIQNSTFEEKKIFEYRKMRKTNDAILYREEMLVLGYKNQKLKIKVGERLPVYSRCENHKWMIIKDKYSHIYLILYDFTLFEELFLYSLFEKISKIVGEERHVLHSKKFDDMVPHFHKSLFLLLIINKFF